MKESKLESFQSIYRRACERKGGERVLEAMLQAPLSKAKRKNYEYRRQRNYIYQQG